MTRKRSLYQCCHARVLGDRIYCRRGYRLSPMSKSGHILLNRLARGEALELECCQRCPDFDYMGPPVAPEDRGWLKKKANR